MLTTNISTLQIHRLTQEQYERELAAGNLDENAFYLTPDEGVDLSGYMLKPTLVTTTMAAANWSGNTYSFEATYPAATYDIEIMPDGDNITTEQFDAFNAMFMVGLRSVNAVKAFGTVPAIDIPIFLKVQVK